MRKKRILIIIGIVAITLMTNPIKVEAALQSNGDTPITANVNDWIYYTRQMQATGGTLGLTDTITDGTLTSNNPNLDIHMQKNTEYGALVILSASSYGNPNTIADGQTTTGNATGVVMRINGEWVVATTSGTEAANVRNAANRYKNQYTGNYVEKSGDAVATIGAWHGASNLAWFSGLANTINVHNRACLIRAYSGSIMSFNGWCYDSGNGGYDIDIHPSYWRQADYRKTWHSRAAVVVGSGI